MKTKLNNYRIVLIFLLFSLLIVFNCKKEPLKVPPTVNMTSVTNITSVSASTGGNVTADGGASVTARGICWSATNKTPTTTDGNVITGKGLGSFTTQIVGLSPGTTYYASAYASNSIGTAYSSPTSFTTLATAPNITTTELSSVTTTTALGGGMITTDGGSPVTSRGVCWSTNQNPTIADSKTSDGTGTGTFVSSISGLSANTKYYVRAYATNSIGTIYGKEVLFSTLTGISTITTTGVYSITALTATIGGNISNDGGSIITDRGVCWSTTPNPTIACNKTNEGNGIGTFESSLTWLYPNTTYYGRTYATNSFGITYGNELSFKTLKGVPTFTALSVTDIAFSTAKFGCTITDDGGSAISVRGVCWGPSSNPTIWGSKTLDGTGSGSFTSSISGFLPNTRYFVRAYATNMIGTSYSDELSFTSMYGEVTDSDGNIYRTIKIGNQVWTVDNLKTTKYNDGTPIPLVPEDATWTALTTGAYCWYDNDAAKNKNVYGALYNWYAVNTNKLAPTGWHVASDEEWWSMAKTFGEFDFVGGKLKESGTTHWLAPNAGATNESAFTALPGGARNDNGSFYLVGRAGYWWSSTESSILEAWPIDMYFDKSSATRPNSKKQKGYSVRCVLGVMTTPTIETSNIINLTSTSATCGGTITADGGSSITARGVCWSTNLNPTISDNKSIDGTGIGIFTSNLSGLTLKTTYYVRAYATNKFGTNYGSQKTFIPSGPSIASVTTTAVSGINPTGATLGGILVNDGNAAISERGFVYGTSPLLSSAITKVIVGSGVGSFSFNILGLTPGSTYYVWAYAVNSQGTAFGNQVSFMPIGSTKDTGTVTDVEGKIYKTVTIGTQVWMAENLKTTKYRDGEAIPNIRDDIAWSTLLTGAFCWYKNDVANYGATYGALYNWFTVNTGRLCPDGWHVPSDIEWTTLTTYLGGENVAGGKMKENGSAHWWMPNTGATNSSGFSALPGSGRYDNGSFFPIGGIGYWWSSTEDTPALAWYRTLYYSSNSVTRTNFYKGFGYSVRCVGN